MENGSRDILIVDDDRQVREVLHQIFMSAGYGCRLAEDGRAGVEAYTAQRPELVVTDLKMPVMGGIELLQQIRAADGDAAVIVLTGAADVKTAIDSLKLGAYDFIMKPVNVEELLIAAERALERRQLLIERRAYQAMLERRVEEATQHLTAAYQELEATYGTTLEALGSALDTRDIGTESHSRRVHGYALASALTWTTREAIQVFPIQRCPHPTQTVTLCRFRFLNMSSWYRPRPGQRSFLLVNHAWPPFASRPIQSPMMLPLFVYPCRWITSQYANCPAWAGATSGAVDTASTLKSSRFSLGIAAVRLATRP